MNTPGPKPPADEKMEHHFNGIVMTVLAVIAIVLIVVVIFVKAGTHAPRVHQSTPAGHPAPQ